MSEVEVAYSCNPPGSAYTFQFPGLVPLPPYGRGNQYQPSSRTSDPGTSEPHENPPETRPEAEVAVES